MKRCATSLFVGKMQMNTTQRQHCTITTVVPWVRKTNLDKLRSWQGYTAAEAVIANCSAKKWYSDYLKNKLEISYTIKHTVKIAYSSFNQAFISEIKICIISNITCE